MNPSQLPHHLQSILAVRKSRPDSAQVSLPQIKSLAIDSGVLPEEWNQIVNDLEDYIDRGSTYLSQKNYPDAIEEFAVAEAIDPTRVEVLLGLAQAH